MIKNPFNKINFLFLNNYYYHAPCINFNEIEDIVNTYTEDDIDNDNFDWGNNCDMDRTPVRNSNILPLISDNFKAFADEVGAKVKAKLWEPWLNTYKKAQYQDVHDHAEHYFAAIIFMNEGVDFAKLYFMDTQKSFSPPFIQNVFQMDDVWYPHVGKGDIIIFPGHMLHGVSPHKNDEIRKTLSLNIDVIEAQPL